MRISKQNKEFINQEMRKIQKGKITRKKVAKNLGTTEKTIGKWFKTYESSGSVKTKEHTPINKLSKEYNKSILNLYSKRYDSLKIRYPDPKALAKALPTIKYFKDTEGITASKEHIRKLFVSKNIITFRTQRKNKKIIRVNLKKKLSDTKNPILAEEVQAELAVLEHVGLYRGKTGAAGYRIEVDGDFFEWFGGTTKYCLHLAVDSFTGFILNIWIGKEETNIGYLGLLRGVFNDYGVPVEGRTDGRNGLAKGKVNDAWKMMGTEVTSSHEPTFKPNVERKNGFLQGILPNLFMDKNIDNIDDFAQNKKGIIKFLNDYLEISMPEDNCFMEPEEKLLQKFFLKSECKVVNEISHVNINNKKMAPFKGDKRILLNKIATVYQEESGKYFCFWNKTKCYLKEITDIKVSPKVLAFEKGVENERKKGISYRNTMRLKTYEVNKKIEQLQGLGVDITPLENTL